MALTDSKNSAIRYMSLMWVAKDACMIDCFVFKPAQNKKLSKLSFLVIVKSSTKFFTGRKSWTFRIPCRIVWIIDVFKKVMLMISNHIKITCVLLEGRAGTKGGDVGSVGMVCTDAPRLK